MSIRSFIAISIPKTMANALGDAAAKMAYQDKSNAVRWADQANYHVTLAFLGEQTERDLESLAERLDDQLPTNSFEMAISHISPFPESKPKLIAAMLAKSFELSELHERVISSVSSCGLHFDKRRFNPHITLGRFRHSKNAYAGVISSAFTMASEVGEVVLYESVLTPSGAEYEPLYRFPLDYHAYQLDEI